MRARSARRPRSSRTASTRPTRWAAGCGSGARTCRVEFVPFGVDVDGVPADRRAADRRRRLGRRRSSPRLRAAADRRPGDARDELPASSRRPTAPARSPVGRRNVAVETDLPFDADAPPARARARRRPSRAREQLLGGDDGAAPGDGAREAGRRHADGGDRHGLRARRRARTCGSSHPGDAAAFGGGRSTSCWATSGHARALGARARATVERELTWDRYVGRLEACSERPRSAARARCRG